MTRGSTSICARSPRPSRACVRLAMLAALGLHWLMMAFAPRTEAAVIQVTNFFRGSMPLDGNITHFFDASGTPLPGVAVGEDPEGLSDSPLSGAITRDGNPHPSGFNQRRILAAYNPGLDGGTVFVGIDLPGGTGSPANPDYRDALVGTRGSIRPFDADGNGEADFIGRQPVTGEPVCACVEAVSGLATGSDVWDCAGAGALGATDNPRGGLGAEEEFYRILLAFGESGVISGRPRVYASFRIGQETPDGVAELQALSLSTVGTFQVRASSDTGGTGAPRGCDVMFAISEVNAVVTNQNDRFWLELIAFTGSTADGPGQTEDYNTLRCVYRVPPPVILPELRIRRPLAGQSLEVCWPDTGAGFGLEWTASLFLPSWEPVTTEPVRQDGEFTVTLPVPANGSRFFRLKWP